MTKDKQNFGKDINVPSKNNKYRLGRTKIERQQIFEDIKEMIENGFSLQNIADKYGVTRQAISLKMINCGFNVSQEVKRIKREKIKKLLEETSVNNVEKLNRKVKYYKTYNIRLRNDLTELKEKLSRKEQECERLKQTLAEIKEVLQFYNNTTIGVYKGNGIFEFEVSNDNVLGGKLIYCYDTNPAKEALQKISECEVE